RRVVRHTPALVPSATRAADHQLPALPLPDALPISLRHRTTTRSAWSTSGRSRPATRWPATSPTCCWSGSHRLQAWRTCCGGSGRSEEHTSELQSRENLVCRLLLEKKNSSGGDGDEE